MTPRDWTWKILLTLFGAILTGIVYEGVIGGGVLGWIAGGAIMGATGGPLFKALMARNAAKAAQGRPPRA